MELLDLTQLKLTLREFAKQRAWEKFHSPKNLSMALACESAELLEIFQWLKEEDSFNLNPDSCKHVAQEIADIILYAVRLADILAIDVDKAIKDKLVLNAQKYPGGSLE